MKAYVFPGQGAQFVGMGKDLYEAYPEAKDLFEKANDILGFRITDIMFDGTDEELKQTKVTQPAIFLHSVITAKMLGDDYNCPGQLVISGAVDAINEACEKLTESGARRALVLPVGGAFHSPLMEPAREELAAAINATDFGTPACPVYQNVTAKAVTNSSEIKENLIAQLTAPVKWTQTMNQMISDGCTSVVECGPGKVLQGLFKKVDRKFETSSAAVIEA